MSSRKIAAPTVQAASGTVVGNHEKYGSALRSPIIAKAPSTTTIRAARFAVFFTFLAWLGYIVEQVVRLANVGLDARTLIETSVYLGLVTLLMLSASAYLITRVGYFERTKSHHRVPRITIDDFFDEKQPTLTVLVPSYREDERVLRQTLLSAALQEYPNLRVVALLDDPPHPTNREHQRALERARAVPGLIAESLREPYRLFTAAMEELRRESVSDVATTTASLERLAGYYETAVEWFDSERRGLSRVDHTDEFLASQVFDRTMKDLQTTAAAIREVAKDAANTISQRRVLQLYSRLVRIFQADLTSFERKQFVSLSHEANKAMNLNSYLGLMGGRYSIVAATGGSVLLPTKSVEADLEIPDSDYVLTLDADSMLLPEYCLRLVYFMEQDENSKVAVAQTPYSAYPGATSRLERIAGATTDIQHIAHQGLTHYGATFWVGANAVIRKRALDELEVREEEAGFIIKRYIKDRTVIEDTESSIDLRSRGWSLYNYPERLSYSASPADFGSLAIQRQRWSNGGLVILPALLRLVRRGDDGVTPPSLAELFLRVNYLASVSWASLGLLLLLFFPFDGALLSRLAVITALPYFWTMANDLHRSGYRRLEIFSVYGFNLLLLPVNLAGTIQSIIQGIGGQRIAFARTPKVRNHTVAPLLFVLLPIFLFIWSGRTLLQDINSESYVHGLFAGINMVMTAYAAVFLVGPRTIVLDILINIREFVYREPAPVPSDDVVPRWASVLYIGSSVPEEIERSGTMAVALAAQDRIRSGNEAVHEA